MLAKISQQSMETAEALDDMMNTLKDSRVSLISDAFTQLGESIGQMAAQGELSFQSFASSVGNILADIAKKIGAMLIGIGAANLLIPGMQGLGALQIGAGIALVGAGSFASGKLQAGGGGQGGGSGGELTTSVSGDNLDIVLSRSGRNRNRVR